MTQEAPDPLKLLAQAYGELRRMNHEKAEREMLLASARGMLLEQEALLAEYQEVLLEQEALMAECQEVLLEQEALMAECQEVLLEQDALLAECQEVLARFPIVFTMDAHIRTWLSDHRGPLCRKLHDYREGR